MEAVRFLENRQQHLVESTDASESSEAQTTSSIKIEALKELTLALLKEVESLKNVQAPDGTRHLSLQEEVRRFESEMIRWALKRTSGHQRRAARLLGVKVTTLHAKIKRYRIHTNVFSEDANDLGLDGAQTETANS